jgi:hypothetical protein
MRAHTQRRMGLARVFARARDWCICREVSSSASPQGLSDGTKLKPADPESAGFFMQPVAAAHPPGREQSQCV